MQKIKAALLIAWIVLVALFVIAIFFPGIGALVSLYTGRAPGCSLVGTTLALRRNIKMVEAAQRLPGQSHTQVRENGLMQVETPVGAFWEPHNPKGSEVLSQLAEIEGKYSSFAKSPAHPGDVVLDCGANIGMFTREALARGARLVVAIEPVPVNLECLRRNMQRDIDAKRVIVVPKGVWYKEDVLILHESDSSSAEDSFVRSQDTHQGAALPLTTIDKIVEDLKLDRVDFIKMDIEGSEPNALRGAQKTLARFHPRLEVEVSGNEQEILGIVRQARPYQLECLICLANAQKKAAVPTMINLEP